MAVAIVGSEVIEGGFGMRWRRSGVRCSIPERI